MQCVHCIFKTKLIYMNHYKIIIIGSGFGGQCAAINLLKQHISDFCILERRSFMGGTWCQNTYPGAAVDVQSPLYSLSFEPYNWSQMFAEQKELNEYTNYVIDKYKLREKTKINTNVEEIKWNENQSKWEISTNNGLFSAQFIINASGPLSTPTIPNFKGKDSFKNESFHTNDWNWDYDYKNKKVAVLGSGASAAQVIPTIAKDVKELHVFQRTPHWVLPRHDHVFTKFERKLLSNKFIYKIIRTMIYWALESRVIGFKYSDLLLKIVAQNKAEKLIKKTFKNNKELQEKVTPNYTIGCKRIILSNTLYPTFNQKNVFLHAKTDAIAEITENAIITTQNDKIDLDLIVYATGYDATDGVISYPVIGKKNILLQDYWEAFPRAYLGTTIPNFPNFFVVTGPNTGIGHTSAIFIIEAQMHYILKSINAVDKQQKQFIEVTQEAEDRYTENIHKEMEKTVWQSGGCNSWYKSKSGHVIAMFPGFSFTYLKLAKNFKLKDHKLT